MKTPPRDLCKRTCGTLVVHLGAFKSQLVTTIVPYIYIFILNLSCLIARFGIQFPTDHYNDPVLLRFPWWLRHGAMDPIEGTVFLR